MHATVTRGCFNFYALLLLRQRNVAIEQERKKNNCCVDGTGRNLCIKYDDLQKDIYEEIIHSYGEKRFVG